MPFQLVTALVNLGSRNETIVPLDPPVTYPEYLVLRAIHGSGAVTDPVDVGDLEEDRSDEEERRRLAVRFGDEVVKELFPGALAKLPERGDLPTLDEVKAVREATEKAKAEARAKAKKVKKTAAPAAIDDQLGDLEGKGA